MKALSVWQPHALAIGLGLKPWETRGWHTRYRGPLAIHASLRPWRNQTVWDVLALLQFRRKLFPSVGDVERNTAMLLINKWLIYGAVVCMVDLVDCVRTSELRGRIPPDHEFWGDFSDGEDGKGRYAFKLENVRVLPEPVPWRGMQGFFEVDLGGEERAAAVPEMRSLFDLRNDEPVAEPEPVMRSLFEGL